MSKRVAVLAVNPVNGLGLFQYLEAFFENKIKFKLFAVAENEEIKTNSGVTIFADDVIANLKDKEDEYDALVFGCGDAVPKFSENASKAYNKDMLQVIKQFGDKAKIMIGHCGAGIMFDSMEIANGVTLAVHPMVKSAVKKAKTTDEKVAIDGNFYTAEDENSIREMMPQVIEALK